MQGGGQMGSRLGSQPRADTAAWRGMHGVQTPCSCLSAEVLGRPPVDTSTLAVAAVQPPFRRVQPLPPPLLNGLLRAAVHGRKLGRVVLRKTHLGGDAVAVGLQPVVPHGRARQCFPA